MRARTAILRGAFILMGVSACAGEGDMRQAVFESPPAPALTASVGDTVMDVHIMRPPLSAVALSHRKAVIEMGRVQVEFAGMQNRRAVLVRHYLAQTSDGAAPLWTPTGVAPSAADYVAAAQPQAVALAPGEVLPLEGRKLTVRRVDARTLEYAVE